MTNDLNNTPEKTAEEIARDKVLNKLVQDQLILDKKAKFNADLAAMAEKDETVKVLLNNGTLKAIIDENPHLTQLPDSVTGISTALSIATDRYKAKELQRQLEEQKANGIHSQTPVDTPLNAGGQQIQSASAKDSDPIDFSDVKTLMELEKQGIPRATLKLAKAMLAMQD